MTAEISNLFAQAARQCEAVYRQSLAKRQLPIIEPRAIEAGVSMAAKAYELTREMHQKHLRRMESVKLSLEVREIIEMANREALIYIFRISGVVDYSLVEAIVDEEIIGKSLN
jgi:hypothetical protein